MSFGQPLSKAETRVCRLVARGMTDREIALTLGLKLKTVKARLSAAYKKLGVSTRYELIAEAFDWSE